jgi:sugar phosphate permease
LKSTSSEAHTAFSSEQRLVLWVLWLTYGSFYFCRNNLGVALPGIQAELGYTKSQLGTVLMALKLSSYYNSRGFGDFSATTMDPNDGTFWTMQEFSSYDVAFPGTIWGTWIMRVSP